MTTTKHFPGPCRIRALGGNAEDLLRVAAHLYSLQGRPELALAIYLRLQQPDVFSYIATHGLVGDPTYCQDLATVGAGYGF